MLQYLGFLQSQPGNIPTGLPGDQKIKNPKIKKCKKKLEKEKLQNMLKHVKNVKN